MLSTLLKTCITHASREKKNIRPYPLVTNISLLISKHKTEKPPRFRWGLGLRKKLR